MTDRRTDGGTDIKLLCIIDNKKDFCITGEIEKPIIKKGAVTDMAETDIEHENVKTEGSNEKVKANIAGKLASSQEKMSHGQFRR